MHTPPIVRTSQHSNNNGDAMGTAISLLIIFTLSAMVVKTGATILRLTGLTGDIARFQARSAFTGTGFTTSEAEQVLNHPVRRKVITYLIVLGNVGLVSVVSTVIVSFVAMDNGDLTGVLQQLVWFAGVLAVFWMVVLNPIADRIFCGAVGAVFGRILDLDGSGQKLLLQISSSSHVHETIVDAQQAINGVTLRDILPTDQDCLVLGVRRSDGKFLNLPKLDMPVLAGDAVITYR